METLYSSSGTLHYERGDDWFKVHCAVDQGISDYYRAMIPNTHIFNRQKYPAHISVVRNEIPPNMDVWGIHENQEIEFQYSNVVHFGTVYCWLNVFSKRLEEIRLELGLPVSSQYTLPPEGYIKCFHLTIANQKQI